MGAAANAVASNTAQMKRSMREVEQQTRESNAAMTKMKDTLVGFGEALGVALSVGAIVSFGREVAKSTAELAVNAKTIGMSVEQLQAYRLAATASGASSEVADTAIRKFTRSMGEAKEGNKAIIDVLKSMGLTANDIAGSPSASLPKIVGALLGISDTAERARDEVRLFGRAGQEVEAVLAQWGKSSDELVEHFKSLGLIISSELAEKMEKAAVAQELAWSRIKAAAAPAISSISTAIANLLSNLSGMPASIETLTNKYITLQRYAQREGPTASGKAAQAEADALSPRIIAMRNATLPLLAPGSFQPDLSGGASAAKGWENAADVAAAKKLAEDIAHFKIQMQEAQNSFLHGWKFTTNAAESDWNDFLAGRVGRMEAASEKILAAADRERERFKLEQEAINSSRDAYIKNYDEQISKADSLRGALANITNEGLRGFNNLGDAIKNMGLQIMNLIYQLTVMEPLMDALTGKKGSPLGGVIGSIVGAFTGGPSADMSNMIDLQLPGRAAGGPVSAGASYTVGENGPETFVPAASGQIIPNGGRGGSQEINITIEPSPLFAVALRAVKNQAVTESVGAVKTKVRNNGGRL